MKRSLCEPIGVIPTSANLLLVHLEEMAKTDINFGNRTSTARSGVDAPASGCERERVLEYAQMVARLGRLLEDHR